MRRERDHAIATPLSLVSRLAKATSRAEVRWIEAKEQADFSLFAPHLEEVVALTRDRAQVLSKALGLAPYDALIDEFSPGFLGAEIDQLFRVVARRLPESHPRRDRAAGGDAAVADRDPGRPGAAACARRSK